MTIVSSKSIVMKIFGDEASTASRFESYFYDKGDYNRSFSEVINMYCNHNWFHRTSFIDNIFVGSFLDKSQVVITENTDENWSY